MKHTDPRITPIYSGEPTGRPPVRYEVQVWEVGLLTTDIEPEWQDRFSWHNNERDAIKEAKRLQARGHTVRVVSVREEAPEERAARYAAERKAHVRGELRFNLWMTGMVVAIVVGILAVCFWVYS